MKKNFKNNIVLLSVVVGFNVTHAVALDKSNEATPITLQKIMSDPAWISNTPSGIKWLPDSRHVVFNQKQVGTSVEKTMRIDTNKPESLKRVGIPEYHKAKLSQLTYNSDKSLAAYTFSGDIFLWHVNSSKVKQITDTSNRETSPQFLNSGDLAYWESNRFITYNMTDSSAKERFKIAFSDAPSAPKGPSDIIAKEQHDLINYVANKHKQSVERFENRQTIKENNKVANKPVFYFDKSMTLETAKVSPSGDRVLAVIEKKSSWRGENDVMPNYIAQDGRIKIEKVRRRVADAKPSQQEYWLIDLSDGSKHQLSINTLPDFDKDVLKSVKEENAKAEGTEYVSKKEARTINLMEDWYWSQSPIQWHSNGQQVAIMLEAWDNKDRWIASVDFEKKKFVPQHQLHDDAWINYTFNEFGWFNQSEKLYFLSEESGYSHLYVKSLNRKKAMQVTKGDFEVSNVTLTSNDKHFYLKANVNHPGEYHVYRVETSAREISKPTAITTMVGENNYTLSPNEQKVLIEHSSLLKPMDLYAYDIASQKTTQLTNTVTEEFNNMPFKAPEIIAVPSSNTTQPIYAKVYYPADYKSGEMRRAVIFNHGAGYLQNSHKGWSGYFREFMFHNFLAQQGYVVMDMDFRASKGYGRDWRTAIYRNMGEPEVQDLQDGVNWLVENANVDRKRIGTYGGSYGGFLTFMAMFKEPELFRAGAALRPVSDWAHYNDGYTSNILNRPTDDMIAYRRSSPIYYAEGLQKPLLINAPMVDNNVFFVDVVRLVQRFIELEKEDFETAIYPVEPHGFKQPSSWLDEYRRIFKLFETNL